MRSSLFTSLLTLLSLACAAPTTSITLQIPPSHVLPNPRTLPPSTHAKLTSLGADATAYVTPANTFVFRNISEGSYLLDVYSTTHAFAPLRVDVLPVVAGDRGEQTAGLKVAAWETYRGNDWDNKGEVMVKEGGRLEVKVLGAKAFFMERSSCKPYPCDGCWRSKNLLLTRVTVNVLSILKNPMILLGLASMAIFLGMPYLVDNSKSSALALPRVLSIVGSDRAWQQWTPRCARSGKKARRATQ